MIDVPLAADTLEDTDPRVLIICTAPVSGADPSADLSFEIVLDYIEKEGVSVESMSFMVDSLAKAASLVPLVVDSVSNVSEREPLYIVERIYIYYSA